MKFLWVLHPAKVIGLYNLEPNGPESKGMVKDLTYFNQTCVIIWS